MAKNQPDVMQMLDDLNYITQYDPRDVLGLVTAQPNQLLHDFGVHKTTFTKQYSAVVVMGVGDSSLPGEIAQTLLALPVPLVCTSDALPSFVTEQTLVVCLADGLSDVTEILAQTAKRKADTVVIARQDVLAKIAKDKAQLLVELPVAEPARMGVLYAFRALVEVLIAASLPPQQTLTVLERSARFAEGISHYLSPTVSYQKNLAKQLALHMVGKTAIIYTGPNMLPVAHRWKLGANQNAKNLAWCNVVSVNDASEQLGWTGHPIEKPFAAINLASDFEQPAVLKYFQTADKTLSGFMPKAVTVTAQGEQALEQLLYLLIIGDFATTYLAILNGTNPVKSKSPRTH